jgi:hypothetical protein
MSYNKDTNFDAVAVEEVALHIKCSIDVRTSHPTVICGILCPLATSVTSSQSSLNADSN